MKDLISRAGYFKQHMNSFTAQSFFQKFAVLLILSAHCTFSAATESPQLLIACATNFLPTLKELVAHYSAKQSALSTSIKKDIQISSAASGTLTQQIIQGAPFDIFLSADAALPKLLEEKKLTEAGSRRLYAVGTLALLSRQAIPTSELAKSLVNARLSIANPKTAPYGRAAQQVLQKMGIAKNVNIVTANNVVQAYQHFVTANVEFALTSQSLVDSKHTYTKIPSHWHAPIQQYGALLSNGRSKRQAALFYDYLHSAEAQEIIVANGYEKK